MEATGEHSRRYPDPKQEVETLRKRVRFLERFSRGQLDRSEDLEKEIQGREARIHEQNAHIQEQEARIRVLESELQAMLFSRSWRITAPLRRVAGWLRTLRDRTISPTAQSAPDAEVAAVPAPTAPTVPENHGIEIPVAAFTRGAQPDDATPVREARIYVAAEGNHFFREIGALIQCGFADIGVQAELVVAESLNDCANPANAGAGLHLVIAPHELFHFIPQARVWPHAGGRLWMLNTEQTHTGWFAEAKTAFGMADRILDMDIETAAALAQMGYTADHLPLGFSPACHIFDGASPVERNLATMGIPARIRNWTDTGDVLGTPLAGRPLDCCFFGTSTARRTEFFARHAALFADLESYLRLQPLADPLRVGVTTPMSTECTSSIVRRSKVSLNIHQARHSYFEWHRIILQGIWQGAAVLSEPCTPAWPFRPNIDYLEADFDRMTETLEYLLRSADGQSLAERVRAQARATLTEHCRMGERLEELLRPRTGAGAK